MVPEENSSLTPRFRYYSSGPGRQVTRKEAGWSLEGIEPIPGHGNESGSGIQDFRMNKCKIKPCKFKIYYIVRAVRNMFYVNFIAVNHI